MRTKSNLFPHFHIIPNHDMVQAASREDHHAHIVTQSSRDRPDTPSEEKIQSFLQQAAQCEQDENWSDTITTINAFITFMSPPHKRKIEWECYCFALFYPKIQIYGSLGAQTNL